MELNADSFGKSLTYSKKKGSKWWSLGYPLDYFNRRWSI